MQESAGKAKALMNRQMPLRKQACSGKHLPSVLPHFLQLGTGREMGHSSRVWKRWRMTAFVDGFPRAPDVGNRTKLFLECQNCPIVSLGQPRNWFVPSHWNQVFFSPVGFIFSMLYTDGMINPIFSFSCLIFSLKQFPALCSPLTLLWPQWAPSDRPHYSAFFQNSLYSKIRSYFTSEKKLTKIKRFILLASFAQSLL